MSSLKFISAITGTATKKNLLKLFGRKKPEIDPGYNQEFIISTLIQMFEFAQIIETNTNPNTVLRVYKLMATRRKTLIIARNNPGFNEDFKKGCDSYSKFYNGRSVTHINVLDNSDEEMEKYFLKHYRRCWLDYIKEQNVVIKQLQGSNNREISRNILLEKFRMVSDDVEWDINDLTAFHSLKSELSGVIKKSISWGKNDFVNN
ncbi:MAG: hypothetical protein WDO19_07350 [Bacteroidota bacterium]